MARGESKRSISFRLDPSTVQEIRRRGAQAGHGGQVGLAERYLIEGMRQDDHPLIHFRGEPEARRPGLLGSRLDVADVITTIRQNENSPEEAASYLEIPIEEVRAAVAYYAEYKDEVDSEITEREEFTARERARWERQQEALA